MLVLAAYGQAALRHGVYNWRVASGDQNSYLRLALRIHEGEGFANGNFHPLVAFLFSPFASRDWSFFAQAKLLDMLVGAAVLLLVFALGTRLFGAAPALATVAFLAFSPVFVARAARAEPEMLLTGLVFAAWACWVLSLRRADDRRWAAAAGLLAGLAYLTKGTGQFLLAGFLLLPLLRWGPRGWWLRRRALALMVALYLLAAAPLLFTNWRAFGSPFYAFPSAHAMWYDDWDERLASPDGRHVTWRTYVASHSAAQAAERLRDGLVEVPEEWGEAFTSSPPTGTPWLLAGLLALLAAVTLAWRRRAAGADSASVPDEVDLLLANLTARLRDAMWALAVVLLPLWIFFAWYAPIANSSRFVLPFVPAICLTLAAAGRAAIWRWLPGLAAAGRRTQAVPIAVGLMALMALRQGEWRAPADVFASDQENNAGAIALTAYLGGSGQPGETIVWGPGSLATWTLHGRTVFTAVPEGIASWSALAEFLDRSGARRFVLAPDMVDRRADALAPYFHRTEDDYVAIDALPPGWRLAWQWPDEGCGYCVFERGDGGGS
jgi:hypothetical protein